MCIGADDDLVAALRAPYPGVSLERFRAIRAQLFELQCDLIVLASEVSCATEPGSAAHDLARAILCERSPVAALARQLRADDAEVEAAARGLR